MFRPSNDNAALIENLDRALNDLPLFFEDQKSKFYPVSRYPHGCDLQYSISGKQYRAGLAHGQLHAFLAEEPVRRIPKNGLQFLGQGRYAGVKKCGVMRCEDGLDNNMYPGFGPGGACQPTYQNGC